MPWFQWRRPRAIPSLPWFQPHGLNARSNCHIQIGFEINVQKAMTRCHTPMSYPDHTSIIPQSYPNHPNHTPMPCSKYTLSHTLRALASLPRHCSKRVSVPRRQTSTTIQAAKLHVPEQRGRNKVSCPRAFTIMRLFGVFDGGWTRPTWEISRRLLQCVQGALAQGSRK